MERVLAGGLYVFVLFNELSKIIIIFILLLLERNNRINVLSESFQLLHQFSLFDNKSLNGFSVNSQLRFCGIVILKPDMFLVMLDDLVGIRPFEVSKALFAFSLRTKKDLEFRCFRQI